MSPTPEPEILEKIRRKAGLIGEENIDIADNAGNLINLAQSAKPKGFGKFLRKLESRIIEMINDLEGRVLNEEEAGILSVITGKKKIYRIRIDDLGNIVAFLRAPEGKVAQTI